MTDDAPLSQLCSICNISPFKYKCPGCGAQTCSLPCYKRHQTWAQCSGKRDPTKFVKRSQLETPAGIDHDFNFLTSIERGLQKAERVSNATSGSASNLQHGANRRKVSNQQFSAAGVAVIRAPQGLSRQKQNATHRGKSGHIIWSVEWIRDDNSHIFTECSEVETLQRLNPFRSSRKRKRGAQAAADHVSKSDEIQAEAHPPAPRDDPNEEPPLHSTVQPGGPHTADNVSTSDVEKEEEEREKHLSSASRQVAHNHGASLLQHVPGPEPLPPTHTFYLLKPQTLSTRKVLIPLSPNATLASSLRGRTVLEFPTIYVFPASVTTPPMDVFMMEETYLKQEREEQAELDDVLKGVDEKTLRGLESTQAVKEEAGDEVKIKEDEIDGEAILDVLKRDLGAKGLTL